MGVWHFWWGETPEWPLNKTMQIGAHVLAVLTLLAPRFQAPNSSRQVSRETDSPSPVELLCNSSAADLE